MVAPIPPGTNLLQPDVVFATIPFAKLNYLCQPKQKYMNNLRAISRGIRVAILTLWCVAPVVFRYLIGRWDVHHALETRRRWARKAIKLLGIQVELIGNPAVKGACLYIGNHRSYIDPIVVLTEVPAWPVAKAEVSSWPIFGMAAKMTGILYVKRENRNSRAATLKGIEQLLQQGQQVLIYPEGTTHLEPLTRDFRPGTFRLAASGGFPVVPMAIHYADPNDAWVGQQTFLPHFLRTFGKKHTHVKLAFGKPMVHDDPQILMQMTKSWIDGQLSEWHSTAPVNVEYAASGL